MLHFNISVSVWKNWNGEHVCVNQSLRPVFKIRYHLNWAYEMKQTMPQCSQTFLHCSNDIQILLYCQKIGRGKINLTPVPCLFGRVSGFSKVYFVEVFHTEDICFISFPRHRIHRCCNAFFGNVDCSTNEIFYGWNRNSDPTIRHSSDFPGAE